MAVPRLAFQKAYAKKVCVVCSFPMSQRCPPIACHGVFGVLTWPIGCDTPSPFSEHVPLGEHAKWRCDTPPQKGYLGDTCHMKTRQMGAILLCAMLSQTGIARYGGVSRTGPLRVTPYCAILGYYCCDTPCPAILFQAGSHFPKMV